MDLKEFLHNIGRNTLSEDEVKELLKLSGIKTTDYRTVKEESEIDSLSINYPVVMKVCSPEILHKTDVGGVKLNIRTQEEAKAIVREMNQKFPGEKILVETMEKGGVELIMGLIKDPTFGTSIMLGLGGILTEIFQDVAFRVVPIKEEDAVEMISELKGKKLLEGYRGQKVNMQAVIDMLMKLSDLGNTLDDTISQMDLNPVFAREEDAVAVDAKLILQEKEVNK